jgi:hypothetical protein
MAGVGQPNFAMKGGVMTTAKLDTSKSSEMNARRGNVMRETPPLSWLAVASQFRR